MTKQATTLGRVTSSVAGSTGLSYPTSKQRGGDAHVSEYDLK